MVFDVLLSSLASEKKYVNQRLLLIHLCLPDYFCDVFLIRAFLENISQKNVDQNPTNNLFS